MRLVPAAQAPEPLQRVCGGSIAAPRSGCKQLVPAGPKHVCGACRRAAFLDRSGAILRSRQPPSKAARTAMSPAAEPAASPAATEAGVEGSAGPASAAAGSSAAAAGGGNLAAEAAAPPPAVAAAAADEEEGREDTEQEPHSDWVQLLMLHRAAGGQLLRSGAGHTSYEFAARVGGLDDWAVASIWRHIQLPAPVTPRCTLHAAGVAWGWLPGDRAAVEVICCSPRQRPPASCLPAAAACAALMRGTMPIG